MAYWNWGALIYCNWKRREDKEDVCLFGGNNNLSHWVLWDWKIRVQLYKDFTPCIYTEKNKEVKVIEFDECNVIKNKVDGYNHLCDVELEYKWYKFKFYNNRKNVVAEMIDDKWNKWKWESWFEFWAWYENKEKYRKKTHIRLYDILKIKKRKLFFRNKY